MRDALDLERVTNDSASRLEAIEKLNRAEERLENGNEQFRQSNYLAPVDIAGGAR